MYLLANVRRVDTIHWIEDHGKRDIADILVLYRIIIIIELILTSRHFKNSLKRQEESIYRIL